MMHSHFICCFETGNIVLVPVSKVMDFDMVGNGAVPPFGNEMPIALQFSHNLIWGRQVSATIEAVEGGVRRDF